MPTVSELVDDVAGIMKEPRESVNAFARALIDDELLPKSRGRAIARVSPIHVVRLFIAVALNPKIREAAEVVRRYESLVRGGIPSSFPHMDQVERFGEAAARIFENLMTIEEPAERAMWRECRIEIVETWPEATISLPTSEGDEIVRFREPNTAGHGWDGYMKRSAVIQGRAFVFLGHSNRRDYFNPDRPS